MSYHHGDLRHALIEAALALLAETQRWDFSLREVARRAGVSHNAPYAHFPDKTALLAAVGVQGFERLRAATMGASQPSQTAAEALIAIGRAYIVFGIGNAAHYRLMFGQALAANNQMPEPIRAAAAAARGMLRGIILRGARDGSFSVDPEREDELTGAVMSAWSLVHGFTLLAIDGLVVRETDLGTDRIVDMVLLRLMDGIASKDAVR